MIRFMAIVRPNTSHPKDDEGGTWCLWESVSSEKRSAIYEAKRFMLMYSMGAPPLSATLKEINKWYHKTHDATVEIIKVSIRVDHIKKDGAIRKIGYA